MKNSNFKNINFEKNSKSLAELVGVLHTKEINPDKFS